MCFIHSYVYSQVNDLRARITQLSPTEGIFLTATMQFRDTIKGMYSVQVSAALCSQNISFCCFYIEREISLTELFFVANRSPKSATKI